MVMLPDRGQPVYTLKVASGLVGLSPRTIRLYEEAELLAPARTGGNQQRLYSEQDLQWLRCIRDMLHEEGLTVTAIRRLLDLIPCWEIRHCVADVAETCRPHLRIPEMAGEKSEAAAPVAAEAAEDEGLVLIKLIYGVQELGSVLPCSRCVAAERVARRVALKHPGCVAVRKYDVLSAEAAEYGVVLSPTVIVDHELVAAGAGVSEERLERTVQRHLEGADAGSASSQPEGDGA
jgi:MerR family transcriptional regulator/heat shock protein HspR